jgi:hypothetical protein
MAKQKKPTSLVWARVPPDVRQELEQIAASEDRTLAYVVKRLLLQSLEQSRKLTR